MISVTRYVELNLWASPPVSGIRNTSSVVELELPNLAEGQPWEDLFSLNTLHPLNRFLHRYSRNFAAERPSGRRYMGRRAALAAALLSFCCSSRVFAQKTRLVKLPIIEGTDIRFSHVSDPDGPAHTRVARIVQDPQGFLWLGTQDGMQRYDGYRFKAFRPDPKNPNSLSGVYINALFKDRSGKFWVGSDQYLDRYDPATDTFTHFRSAPGDPAAIEGQVFDIQQDRDGMLWLSTSQGLNRLDPATGRSIRYRHKPSDPATLDSDQVMCTLEDSQGTFWVITARGLSVFDRRTGNFKQRFPLNISTIFTASLFEDHASVLWITYSAGNGLASVDSTTGVLTRYSFHEVEPDRNAPSGVNAILEDEDSTLWLSTLDSGLVKLDKNRKQFTRYLHDPSDPDSLSENWATALSEDSEGNIWTGTGGGGVNRFSRKMLPFRNFRHNAQNRNSIGHDYVVSAYRDSHGDLWVGSRGVLNRIDKSGQFTFYRAGAGPRGLSNSNVLSILEDRSGYLWFGTFGGGLDRFDRHTGQFKAYRHDPADPHSLSDDDVSSLHIDPKGTSWAGTRIGLNRFDAKTQTFQLYRAGGDNESNYHSIAEDSDGALWLASWDAGLQRFDPATGQFTTYRHAPDNPLSLSSDHVSTVYIDTAGTIWAGTNGGLDKFDRATKTFTAFDEQNGLANSTVISVLEDRRGNLWLATNNGLSRFDPAGKTFRNYFVSDGLPGNEFNRFGNAYQTASGEMFFCTYSGLVSFFPDEMVETSYVPPVRLTEFRLFGNPVSAGSGSPLQEPINFTRSLTLTHEQNVFALEFSTLSYVNPGRNRYRYKLEGLETNWNETDSGRRFASYTTLAPRDYIFRVQGSNAQGVWNENGVNVLLHILPPWWSTWWFRTGVAGALLLTLWAVYQVRVRSLRQRNRELEAEVAKRTVELKVAKDLAETARETAESANRAKSTFLTNMNHELRTPLNAILGFSRLLGREPLPRNVQEDLRVIQDNGKHLLMLINQVLDLAKIESGRATLNELPTDLHQLLEDLERTFALQTEDKGVQFFLERSANVPRLLYLDQLRLREVLINLLGNAVKFTHQGSVTLHVTGIGNASDSVGRVAFEVRDTGPGISSEELRTVFEAFVQSRTGRESRQGTGLGLTISSNYVRLMGGELRLDSEVGCGTSAGFDIPVRVATTAPASEERRQVAMVAPGQPVYRILVADDGWAMRHLIQRLLVPLGFEVREARDGSEAVQVWKQWRPHFICMDLRMPVMDGFEATRQIKAEPEGKSTIIIAVTASSFEDPRAAAREAGCDGFLRKPFDDADLLDLMHQHLGVRFTYAEDRPASVSESSGPAAVTRALASLPAQLRAKFRIAVAELNVAAIQSVLDEMAKVNSDVPETLRPLTVNFQYGQLLRIIESIESASSL